MLSTMGVDVRSRLFGASAGLSLALPSLELTPLTGYLVRRLLIDKKPKGANPVVGVPCLRGSLARAEVQTVPLRNHASPREAACLRGESRMASRPAREIRVSMAPHHTRAPHPQWAFVTTTCGRGSRLPAASSAWAAISAGLPLTSTSHSAKFGRKARTGAPLTCTLVTAP